MIKRLSSLLLCLALLTPVLSPSLAQAADVSTHTAALDEDITARLAFAGILEGFSYDIDADAPLTRAQAASLIVRAAGLAYDAMFTETDILFADLTERTREDVGILYAKGIVAGTSKALFSPDRPITSEEFCTLLLRMLGYTEASGDFTYEGVAAFTVKIGLAESLPASSLSIANALSLLDTALNTVPKDGSKAFAYTVADGKNASYDRVAAAVLTGESEVYDALTRAAAAVRALDSYTILQTANYTETDAGITDRTAVTTAAYVDHAGDQMRIDIDIDGMDDDEPENGHAAVYFDSGRFFMQVLDEDWSEAPDTDGTARSYYMNLYQMLFGPAADYCHNLDLKQAGDEIILTGFASRASLLLDITGESGQQVNYYYDIQFVLDADTFLPIRAEITYSDQWKSYTGEGTADIDYAVTYTFTDFDATIVPAAEGMLAALLKGDALQA